MKTKIETSRVKFQRLIGEVVNSTDGKLVWEDQDTKATGIITKADFKPQTYLNENLMNKVLKGRKEALIHVSVEYPFGSTNHVLKIEPRDKKTVAPTSRLAGAKANLTKLGFKGKSERVRLQRLIEKVVANDSSMTWENLDTHAKGSFSKVDYKPQKYLSENLLNKILKGRKEALIRVATDFDGLGGPQTFYITPRNPSLKAHLAKVVLAPVAPVPVVAPVQPAAPAKVWGADTFYEDPSLPMPFWNDLNLVECFQKTNSSAAFADLERRYKGLIVRQTKFIFNNMPSAQMGYEWDDVASEMNVCFIKAIRYIGVDYKRQHGLESSLGTVFERYSTSWRNSVLSYWNNKKRSEAREVEKKTVTITDKDTGEEKQVEFKLDKGESYANQNPGLLHTSYVGDYTILAQKGGQCALLDREKMIEEELKKALSTDEMTLFNFLRDKAPRATIANRFGESYMERLRQSLRMKIEKIKETLDFSLT